METIILSSDDEVYEDKRERRIDETFIVNSGNTREHMHEIREHTHEAKLESSKQEREKGIKWRNKEETNKGAYKRVKNDIYTTERETLIWTTDDSMDNDEDEEERKEREMKELYINSKNGKHLQDIGNQHNKGKLTDIIAGISNIIAGNSEEKEQLYENKITDTINGNSDRNEQEMDKEASEQLVEINMRDMNKEEVPETSEDAQLDNGTSLTKIKEGIMNDTMDNLISDGLWDWNVGNETGKVEEREGIVILSSGSAGGEDVEEEGGRMHLSDGSIEIVSHEEDVNTERIIEWIHNAKGINTLQEDYMQLEYGNGK